VSRAISENGVTITVWWKRSSLTERGCQMYTVHANTKDGVELKREQLETLAKLIAEELARDPMGVKM